MKQLMFLCLVYCLIGVSFGQEEVYFRVNQVGYLPEDTKIGIVFSKRPVRGKVDLLDMDVDKVVRKHSLTRSKAKSWGTIDYYYEVDFTDINDAGKFQLQTSGTDWKSPPFEIGEGVYGQYQETLLGFMRPQGCGYNPTLDMVCHSHDCRSYYGAVPDSTYVHLSGGWHDALFRRRHISRSIFPLISKILT